MIIVLFFKGHTDAFQQAHFCYLGVKHALVSIKREIKERSYEKLADTRSKWEENDTKGKAETGAGETEHESRGRKARMRSSAGYTVQAWAQDAGHRPGHRMQDTDLGTGCRAQTWAQDSRHFARSMLASLGVADWGCWPRTR